MTFVASVLRKCWCVYCVLQEEEEEEEEGGLEQTESSEEVVKKAEEEDNKLIDSSPRADSPSQEDHIEKGQLEQVGDWEEGWRGSDSPYFVSFIINNWADCKYLIYSFINVTIFVDTEWLTDKFGVTGGYARARSGEGSGWGLEDQHWVTEGGHPWGGPPQE